MRRALRASLRSEPPLGNASLHLTTNLEVSSCSLFLPLPKLTFSATALSGLKLGNPKKHHTFLFSKGSTPLLLNNSYSLRRLLPFNPCHGLLLLVKRASTSSCSCEGERGETHLEFYPDAVSAIRRSVMSRCSHLWEKKVAAFAEGSSLVDFVKRSIDLSPETMRRFWRVSVLSPEDVVEILTGFGQKVGRREVDFLHALFIWAGKQTGDFRHLPRSYEMMISMLIRARMLREAESLLLQTQTCRVFVPGLNALISQIIQGYVENSDLGGFIALYDRARCSHGVVLTNSCYEVLLHYLVKLENGEVAQRIYMDMVDAGLVSRNVNFALDFVVRMLCRSGRVLEAVNLLRRVRNLGIESRCASLDLIADAYCKKRDFEDLLNFLKEWEHVPSTYVCNKILSSLCRASGTSEAYSFMQDMEVLGFEADAKTFEIFIRWSCREGRLRNAFIYLTELSSKMIKPNVHACNALLGGLFKEGMWKCSKEVYADMVEKGIMPDMSTFRVILAGYCKERKFDEITHILGEMVNRGFIVISPTEDALSKAFSVLGLDLHVKVKRDNSMLCPKAEFFDSLGNGLYLDTDLQMYEKTLARILDDIIFPDFDLLVQEECRRHDMRSAITMKDEAIQHGKILSFSSYSKLLKGLITSRSFIKEALNVLEETPELLNHVDQHTLNLLLQAFSKHGILVKVKLILDVLFQRELLLEADTCTAIIAALCEGGDFRGFQEFWNGPQRNSWIPEFKDIRFLLSSLLKWEMFQELFEVFESMSLKYPQLIPAICNAFVKEFCSTGFTAVGYVFVDEVLCKGLVLEQSAYEHLVTGFCMQKKFTDAFNVLDLMLERNVIPSASIRQILESMLFRSSGIEKAKPLMQVIWSKESEAPFHLGEALLNELHRIGTITKLGCELQKLQGGALLSVQSIVDILIQKYCQENNFRKARELLCLILKINMHLGVSTYRYLVRLTCSVGRIHVALNLKDLMLRQNGFSPNIIYNILIFYLLQGGNGSSVDVVLDDMQQQGCSPDEVSYNFLVNGYYKCGNAEKSVNSLNILISKKLQPTNRSLRTVICHLCNNLGLNEALELCQAITSNDWMHGSVVQTILVKSLISHGRFHEAEVLLGRLQDKDLIPDKANYDILIKRLCRIGRVHTAVNLLNVMLKKGELPSGISYNFALQGLLLCKALDEALDIHAEMLHKKIQPSMDSYDVLIHRLCGNGRIGDAERLLDVILGSGQVPTSSMFHVVIDKYHSENNLCKTSELLEKMQQHGLLPDFETQWSLISNLNTVNNTKGDDGKGFLSHLLSQSGFPAKVSKTKGAKTTLKSLFLL